MILRSLRVIVTAAVTKKSEWARCRRLEDGIGGAGAVGALRFRRHQPAGWPQRMVLVGVNADCGVGVEVHGAVWGYFSRREAMACWCSGPS